jgi:hypothetical protein
MRKYAETKKSQSSLAPMCVCGRISKHDWDKQKNLPLWHVIEINSTMQHGHMLSHPK